MQQRILYFDKTLGASKGVHLGHKKQLTDVNQKKVMYQVYIIYLKSVTYFFYVKLSQKTILLKYKTVFIRQKKYIEQDTKVR